MEIVVLVLCLLGFLLAGFVIFIFARLSAVGADVHSLRRELAGLTQRVDRLAAQAAIPVAPVTAAAAAAPSLGQFVLPGARTDRPPAAASAPADPERDPVPVARAVPAESPQAPPRPPFQLEQLLGANWLARLGIAAIAVAAAFFLQYAFKSGWIGPAAQVGMGVVASVLMVGAGQALIRRERYRSYAEVLTSGGVIILFLSVYAAYNFYRLLPSGPALGVLAVAALAVSALAVRTGSLSVAGICLLGAFAAPALIRAPGGNPLNLYAYLAFLNLWALGLLRFKPWQELVVLSFVCTWSLFFLSSPASRGQVAPVQLFATAFLALGVWSGLQAAADTRRDGSLVPAGFLLVGLAAAAYTAASLAVLWGTTFLGVPAILPAALVACLALVAVAVLSPVSTPESAAPRRGLVWLA